MPQLCVARDGSHRVHAGSWARVRREHTDGAREGEIGVRRPQACHVRQRWTVAQDDGRRPRRRQQLFVLGIREKRDVARAGVPQPGNADNLDVAVALEPALEVRGKLA